MNVNNCNKNTAECSGQLDSIHATTTGPNGSNIYIRGCCLYVHMYVLKLQLNKAIVQRLNEAAKNSLISPCHEDKATLRWFWMIACAIIFYFYFCH